MIFLLNEVVRVLRVNGSAILSLDQVRQNGLVRIARSGDVAWPWNSSGFVGDKADAIVAGSRNHTASETRWLRRRRQIQRVMPLEFSVAVASINDVTSGAGCSPSRGPTSCSRSRAPSSHHDQCIISYLYGTLNVAALYVHKFVPPGGATPGACAAAAIELPMTRLMLMRTEGSLRPEGRNETLRIATVMRTRARLAVAQRARAASSSRRPDRRRRDRRTIDPLAYLESVLGGARLWMREPANCHGPVGQACRRQSPRIGWSDLHTFVPDTSLAAETRRYSLADLWASYSVARHMRDG